MAMKIRQATKYNSFAKIAFTGLAGAGKSVTALETATYLSNKRIAVIEADYPGAVSKYAKNNPEDEGFGFTFDLIELMLDDNDQDIEKPFRPQRFVEAIRTIYATGKYDVLIIDGISSEWEGSGGVLEWVDELKEKFAAKKDPTRQAWSLATPEHRKLFTYILRVRMHVIVTMRAKKETVTVTSESGAKSQKVVLDPIQREEIPYLFDILGILQDKKITIDTSHCPTIEEGLVINRSGPQIAHALRDWLQGDPMPDRPEYDPDVPALGDIYKDGLELGVWAADTFYATAGELIGMPGLNKTLATKVTIAQRKQLIERVNAKRGVQAESGDYIPLDQLSQELSQKAVASV